MGGHANPFYYNCSRKKSTPISRECFFSTTSTTYSMAPRPGLEPGTCGLTVRRSTN